MSKSLNVLEFDLLKELVTRFAGSPLGADGVRGLVPLADRDVLVDELDKVAEAMAYVESNGTIDFSPLQDPSAVLVKLRIAALVLEPGEILALLRTVDLSVRVRNALRGLHLDCPKLSKLAYDIPNLKPVAARIEGKILPSGELADNASDELRRIRVAIQSSKTRIQRVLERYLVRKETDKVLQDDFVTVRNGRFVVPVKVEQKRAVAGVVHGTSSSGATLFLEPMEVIEHNNDLIRLQEEEAQEVARLLSLFTDFLRAEAANLDMTVQQLAAFDVLFAKAKFARQFGCVTPAINDTGRLRLDGARHPLLEETLRGQGRSVVPVSVDLSPAQNVLIISGPNTGGKTVALKTIGLLTLMAHVGLPVPAADASIPVLKQVLADIGDHQSIKESLSTFSSHVLNIAEMIEHLRVPSLVLIDEIGTGTDPDQGAALAIAIIDHFRTQGALIMATTHHNSVKAYAFNTAGVASAAMEFDEASLQPTYRLIGGLAGSSSGLQIARRLGLRDSIIEKARRLVNVKEIEADHYLERIREKMADIERQAADLQGRREALEEHTRALEQAQVDKERERLRAFEAKVNEMAARFQQQAEAALKGVHEKSIRLEMSKEMQRKALHLKERFNQEAGRAASGAPAPSPSELQAGDRVRIRTLSLYGILLRVDGAQAEVNVNGKIIKERVSELELSEAAPIKPKGIQLPPGVHLELADREPMTELNVIGCTVDEALERADQFLDHASLMGLNVVRLIHGHGTGKLKRAIAGFLQSHPQVATFNQTESRGGVTVATLRA